MSQDMEPINQQRKDKPMTTATHTAAPWDADAATLLYATPHEEDAMEMIEIRANITEAGWDTVAFIDAAWPCARANAALIKAAPKLLNALRNMLQAFEEYAEDFEPDSAGVEIIEEARAAITEAAQQ